jgi:hypothetical protein
MELRVGFKGSIPVTLDFHGHILIFANIRRTANIAEMANMQGHRPGALHRQPDGLWVHAELAADTYGSAALAAGARPELAPQTGTRAVG